jgi:hypothetical protein
VNFATKFGKFAGDKLRRAMLLEAAFWMRMYVAAPLGHLVMK